MDHYVEFLQGDLDNTSKYYLKSLKKTEQQKYLEKLLRRRGMTNQWRIADIASGAGTLTYHLSSYFPESTFSLMDLNPEAIKLARRINTGDRYEFKIGDIYELPYERETFDLVFCWQTLSWLDLPEKALHELVRITKPGGSVWLSSLFNLDHDVDLYTRAIDHTHLSGRKSQAVQYNTYSKWSVGQWLESQSCEFTFHPFIPEIDFVSDDRKGLGTYTVNTSKGRIQVSAGILMNWAILEVNKRVL